MLHQKPTKKALQSESYSHPLIKNLQQPLPEDHTKIMPTYQPILPSHHNRTSSKLIRYTTITPSINSTFTAFISPFHPIVEDLPQLSKMADCPSCGCVVNPHSSIQNYSRLTCNICGTVSQIPIFNCEEYRHNFAYQYNHRYSQVKSQKYEPVVDTVPQLRRICLVLEASQYNFQKKLHKGIINCMISLCEQDFEVAFIFFDAKYIYFINQLTLQLTKMPIIGQDALEGWDCLPISEDSLFRHISQFNEQTAELIDAVMYEAFYLKQSVLPQTTNLLDKFLPKGCEVKFFITTLNNMEQKKEENGSHRLLSKIFKDKQNEPEKKRDKKKILSTENSEKSMLALNDYMQFFILTQNTTYQQSIKILGFRICKVYDQVEKYKLEQSIYYDLFENLQAKQFNNVSLFIKTSSCIELIHPEYPSYDLYGQLKMVELHSDARYRSYKLTIQQGNHSTMIPLKFKITSQKITDKPHLQIDYFMTNEKSSKRVILNGECLKLFPQSQMGLELLDDQSLFNDHFRRALSKWNGTNFKELRENLEKEYEQLIRLFKSNYRYDSINFPKTMKHYFLYVYSLLEKLKKNLINSYSIYRLLNHSLQTFSKQLYYRAYRLEDSELRNIKSNRGVLQKYPIVFMENGEELFMIFSDASVSQIKDIFGYYDTISSLANANYELPELSTNTKYRQAINLIRSSNLENFLRLKIIDQESSFFDCYINPGLYDKTDHLDFLRKAWKNA